MKTKMIKISLVALLMIGATVLPAKAVTVTMSQTQSKIKFVAPAIKTEHTKFTVKGNCELCKARIETAAKKVNGVKTAMWDQKTQMIHLEYNPAMTSPKKVMQAIAKVGHDAGQVKATSATYKALPSCCQYKR